MSIYFLMMKFDYDIKIYVSLARELLYIQRFEHVLQVQKRINWPVNPREKVQVTAGRVKNIESSD